MADVRSLLRQQREARRISHPSAAYSDAGKLLCTLCREHIRTEALWDGHIQSSTHRQNANRAQSVATTRSANGEMSEKPQGSSNGSKSDASEPISLKGAPDIIAAPEPGMASHPKRKHSLDDDGDEAMDEVARTKRNRPDVLEISRRSDSDKETTRPHRSNSETLTPPSLTRRPSTTPSQGVELQIPSRPATPSHRDESSASTPGNAGSGGVANGHHATRSSTKPSSTLTTATAGETAKLSPEQVDESEWAAFEADIAAASVPYAEDATISAPAMTAEESAAAAQALRDGDKDDASSRKTKAEVDLEDEKEEATRALEEEFEEMEELEARVQRLRQQREDIRKRRESQGQASTAVPTKSNWSGKENIQGQVADTAVVEDEEEEDDDDEGDEDWDSFRLRGR